MNITDVKVIKLEDSKTLALANITIDHDFVVSGLRILNGKNGLWVTLPNRKDSKGEYHDIAFPITKEAYQTIQDTVLEKYQPFASPEAEEIYNNVAKSKEQEEYGKVDVDDSDLLPF